jgi:hypothetical protein
LTVLASCAAPWSDAAPIKNDYVERRICPPERVVVEPRPELALAFTVDHGRRAFEWWSTYYGSAHDPPSDVAADPERLAIWRARQDADAEAARSRQALDDERRARLLRAASVYEVRGCGPATYYACEDTPPPPSRRAAAQSFYQDPRHCSDIHVFGEDVHLEPRARPLSNDG